MLYRTFSICADVLGPRTCPTVVVPTRICQRVAAPGHQPFARKHSIVAHASPEAVSAEVQTAADDGTPRIGKRCYVKNLPWGIGWQDLKDTFQKCGTVVYADVSRSRDGRSLGWGIVEFETPDEAIAAVSTLNNTEIGGRRMFVREDREDRDVGGRGFRADRARIEGEPSGFQVCVQGLPFAYTGEDLKQLVAGCGEVERVDVKASAGWGTVRFTTKEAANAAIKQFHRSEHEGRFLGVFLDRKA